MPEWTSRTTKLMNIFQLEHNFIKHWEKLVSAKKKNTAAEIKKVCQEQMAKINSFKKHWNNAHSFQAQERQNRIDLSNRILHDNRAKEYNRRNRSLPDVRNRFLAESRSKSSSRISLISEKSKRRSIDEENLRLLQKISTIESTLSQRRMKEEFKKGE